jgi:hypothetical protein
MKRFLVLLLCGMVLSQVANAWEYTRFFEHDIDKNGSLDFVEFTNDTAWKALFDAVDGDKNGSISLEEMRAYDERQAGRDIVWEFNGETSGHKFHSIQSIEIFELATRVDCCNNEIAEVDFQYNTELWEVLCANNQFTSLNFAHNPKLTRLECYGNQIAGEEMDELIASLPTVENGELVVVNKQDDNEKNVCSTDHVAAARAKGWNVYDYNGGEPIAYEGAGNIYGDVNGDGKVSIADVTTLTDSLLNATADSLPNGDVNGDGKVSIYDITILIDYLLSGNWN